MPVDKALAMVLNASRGMRTPLTYRMESGVYVIEPVPHESLDNFDSGAGLGDSGVRRSSRLYRKDDFGRYFPVVPDGRASGRGVPGSSGKGGSLDRGLGSGPALKGSTDIGGSSSGLSG